MILNRQRRVPIPLRELNRFATNAGKALRLPPDSVTVCLVTDREIARWNRAYRGKDAPTDVLSFPVAVRTVEVRTVAARTVEMRKVEAEPRASATASANGKRPARNTPRKKNPQKSPAKNGIAHEAEPAYLGDIAIAPAVARRNALRFGRTFESEMRILILHGMLHLLGYDHETDAGQMDRKERRLRRALGLG